jgi:soluble lytic murein transglycosylase-like protein
MQAHPPVCLAVAVLLIMSAGCSDNTAAPPPLTDLSDASAPMDYQPGTAPDPLKSSDPNSQALEKQVIKSMLYDAAVHHHVHPALIMGLAWWESGWNPSAVSSAGAIGVMQVMPATAEGAGPRLLHRHADVHDLADNIELGTAILKANLDRYHNDLVKALVAYYAGPGAVTDWKDLSSDERRYVWGVYTVAMEFKDGKDPA